MLLLIKFGCYGESTCHDLSALNMILLDSLDWCDHIPTHHCSLDSSHHSSSAFPITCSTCLSPLHQPSHPSPHPPRISFPFTFALSPPSLPPSHGVTHHPIKSFLNPHPHVSPSSPVIRRPLHPSRRDKHVISLKCCENSHVYKFSFVL